MPANKSRNRLTIALALLLAIGYGVPLARGWMTARKVESDPAFLHTLIQSRLDEAEGSVPTREWLGRHLVRLPRESTGRLLLRYLDDPRPGVRYICADWIARFFLFPIETSDKALEPWMEEMREAGWDALLGYVNDERAPALYRFNLLKKYPWLKDRPRGESGWELLQRQARLYPTPLENWDAIPTVINLDYNEDYSSLERGERRAVQAPIAFPAPRHPALQAGEQVGEPIDHAIVPEAANVP